MKTLLKLLVLAILSIIMFSCSVAKHVNKTSSTEIKKTVTDSLATHSSNTSEKTLKTDSSTITTTEHVESVYQVPDVGKTILVLQKIDRKIVEKKAVKVQVAKTATENSNINLNKTATDNQNKKEVTKEVKRTGVPWWVYVIIILSGAALVFIYRNKLFVIIRKISSLIIK